MKYHFTNEKNGQTLTEFLSEKISGVTLNAVKKQLKGGEVKVNGEKTRENITLAAGDEVSAFFPQSMVSETRVPVVYEDENILVADKPAGADTENNLVDMLLAQTGEKLRVVHRLDRNTSGLVILAKDSESEKLLLAAVKDRGIKKFYRALLHGHFDEKEFTAKAYLVKDAEKSKVKVTLTKEPNAKEIITKYRVIADYADHCEAEIELVTGRTHQIRAHSAFLGHPVLGDGKYTVGKASERGYPRQQLRAVRLVFCSVQGKLAYLNGKEITI